MTLVEKKEEEVNIDWNFIKKLEGYELKGYVPSEKRERNNRVVSGVTIASGFDLGQHSVDYLDKLNLKEDLKEKLRPYFGLKGNKARRFLKQNPLVITEAEGNAINKAVKMDKAIEVAEAYNRDAKNINFYSLPKEIQTVIMSVGFQYGNLRKRTPNFWKVVTSGDWERAVWHLNNFGDVYKTRRRTESKKLATYLEKQKPNKTEVV